ncbi:hypothetical protein HMPREF3183_01226, partial [Peptostreptococcus anaerobius]
FSSSTLVDEEPKYLKIRGSVFVCKKVAKALTILGFVLSDLCI